MADDRPNPLADHVSDLLTVLPRLAQVGNALNRGQLVERALDEAGVRLDRPMMSVLVTLMLADEPMRIGEIARRMEVAGPHVTRLLHDLERRGLARRIADPRDKRARLVELTEAGTEAGTGYVRSIFGWFGAALTDWSEQDLQTLGRLLTRLIDDLSAYATRQQTADSQGDSAAG